MTPRDEMIILLNIFSILFNSINNYNYYLFFSTAPSSSPSNTQNCFLLLLYYYFTFQLQGTVCEDLMSPPLYSYLRLCLVAPLSASLFLSSPKLPHLGCLCFQVTYRKCCVLLSYHGNDCAFIQNLSLPKLLISSFFLISSRLLKKFFPLSFFCDLCIKTLFFMFIIHIYINWSYTYIYFFKYSLLKKYIPNCLTSFYMQKNY